MYNNKKLVFGIFFLFNFSSLLLPLEAGEIGVRSGDSSSKIIKSRFTIDTGVKTGHFTYQIGGLISNGNQVQFLHFPLSELRFPLNASLLTASYKMEISNHWRGNFDFGINFSSTPGKMEDSDWGIASVIVDGAIDDPDSLDVYSTSSSEMSLKEYSFHIERDNGKYVDFFGFETWDTYIGFGFDFQDYDFNIYDVVETYPSTGVEPATVDGKVLIYNFFQITPYFSALFESPKKKKLHLTFNFEISPFVHISDFDNHLLRNKISDGSTDGWSAKTEFIAGLRLSPTTDLFLLISSQYTNTNGWQTQTNNNYSSPSVAKVKLKHISSQNNFRVGGRFWL